MGRREVMTPRMEQIRRVVAESPTIREAAAVLKMTRAGVRGYMSVIRRLCDDNREVPETRSQAQVRIAGEVAAGLRCRVCWLWLPCCDHGGMLRP